MNAPESRSAELSRLIARLSDGGRDHGARELLREAGLLQSQPSARGNSGPAADWLGERFRVLNADVLAVQEVWDEVALRGAIARSGLRYTHVSVPGAENGPGQHGAQGTPRVGIVTRLKVESIESLVDFPAAAVVDVPGLGPHTRFERPPLLATLRMKHGQPVAIITAHLKSKRPKYLQDAQGQQRFDGFLQGVFRVEPLMDQLLAQLDGDSFSVRLLENGLMQSVDGLSLHPYVHCRGWRRNTPEAWIEWMSEVGRS